MSPARRRRPWRPRLRDERGFTLPELLVGMTVGLLVILGAFTLLDRSTQLSKRTYQRVDATQRGRLALDLMMRELRSQVCISATVPALAAASDLSVTFYVNLGGPDAVPEKHELALESGNIVLRRWVGSGTPPNMTWPGTATSTRTLLENVQQVSGVPVFRYYTWGAGTPTLPDSLITTPLTTPNLAKPVKIGVAFRALPAADFNNTQGSATLQDSVFVRSSDPTDITGGPRCV